MRDMRRLGTRRLIGRRSGVVRQGERVGGYRGGRPASEVRPPSKVPSGSLTVPVQAELDPGLVAGVAGAVIVWPFRHAPVEYRQHATDAVRAVWLAMVPAGLEAPDWIIHGSQFDRNAAAEHHGVAGGTVWIGCHG